MIFVSFGSHNERFDRLAKAVNELAKKIDEEIVVQYGFTDYNWEGVKAFDYCTKNEMNAYIKDASVLILQGGWGSISESIELGKKIVAVPRIMGEEHNHDQEQLVKKLETLGCLLAVYDIKDLASQVKKAKNYEFKRLKRGSATQAITTALNEWFPHK